MVQSTTRGNLIVTRRDYTLFRIIKLLVDNRKVTPFFGAYWLRYGRCCTGTTFLYHIVPRKRVREEENLGPSRGRELTVFHKCAGPIPILGNKWRKRSDTNGKKASRKGQRQ